LKYFKGVGLFSPGVNSVSYDFTGFDLGKQYSVMGGLTQTDGSGAHVYISTVCNIAGDQQLCGIRDIPDDHGLYCIDWLGPNLSKVTVTLKSTGGGDHIANVIIFEWPG